MVAAVHGEKTPIFAQLWHVGKMTQHTVEGLYVLKGGDYVPPRLIGPSGLFGGAGKSAQRGPLRAVRETAGRAR